MEQKDTMLRKGYHLLNLTGQEFLKSQYKKKRYYSRTSIIRTVLLNVLLEYFDSQVYVLLE